MAMIAGLGPESYCNNSSLQAHCFAHSQSGIKEAIRESCTLFADAKVVCIADLGCSSGPNTIHAMDFVANEILTQSPDSQIHAVFSDLISNDYNTLFHFLRKHVQGKPYFYAAAPGSFYERLFPNQTVHFIMCNFAIHWMSKLPESVMDVTSPACNPGRVYMDKYSNKESADAFAKQAHEDLCQFLELRAQELVPGGILSLLFVGRASEGRMLLYTHFQAAWEEMVREGLISQKCLDSFNMPMFFRNLSDVEKAVDATQCFKVIHKLCMKFPSLDQVFDSTASDYAGKVASHVRSITGTFVKRHLVDERLVDILYEKTESHVLSNLDNDGAATSIVILKRI